MYVFLQYWNRVKTMLITILIIHLSSLHVAQTLNFNPEFNISIIVLSLTFFSISNKKQKQIQIKLKNKTCFSKHLWSDLILDKVVFSLKIHGTSKSTPLWFIYMMATLKTVMICHTVTKYVRRRAQRSTLP